MTLTGVPETALWTLYHRSLAARQGVLEDPKAIALVEQLDYPFAERFGGGRPPPGRRLRVRAFDSEIRRFLKTKPDATIVAARRRARDAVLARGQRPRPTRSRSTCRESVALRQSVLPGGEAIAASALDTAAWAGTAPT